MRGRSHHINIGGYSLSNNLITHIIWARFVAWFSRQLLQLFSFSGNGDRQGVVEKSLCKCSPINRYIVKGVVDRVKRPIVCKLKWIEEKLKLINKIYALIIVINKTIG